MEPRIQYAKTKDGVSIAYYTLGEGMPFVHMPSVQMRFLKRLFRRQNKPAPPRVPSGVAQTGAEKDAARKYWEAEGAADRKRRAATDKRP